MDMNVFLSVIERRAVWQAIRRVLSEYEATDARPVPSKTLRLESGGLSLSVTPESVDWVIQHVEDQIAELTSQLKEDPARAREEIDP